MNQPSAAVQAIAGDLMRIVHTPQGVIICVGFRGEALTRQERDELIALTEPFYCEVQDAEIMAYREWREAGGSRQYREEAPCPQRQPEPGCVYLMQSGPHFKVGVSKDPNKRLAQLNTQPPFELEIIDTVLVDDPYDLEAALHEELAEWHIRGEWFELPDQTVEYVLAVFASEREHTH